MSIDLGKLGYKVYLDDKQYREGMRELLGETQKSSSEIKITGFPLPNSLICS